MKAKTAGLIALGAISIGILIGFIVGAISFTSPGKFNVPGMLITWCIFGFVSIVLAVMAGVIKNQEVLIEQSKKEASENDSDLNDGGVYTGTPEHQTGTPEQQVSTPEQNMYNTAQNSNNAALNFNDSEQNSDDNDIEDEY